MKKDIFKGCFGIGWIIVFIFIIAGIFVPETHKSHFYVVFFFVIAGLCLFNFNRCGRTHCQITGWGFLGVGILALLSSLNLVSISFDAIWIIFIIVAVVGFGYEFFKKGKSGSCYVKK